MATSKTVQFSGVHNAIFRFHREIVRILSCGEFRLGLLFSAWVGLVVSVWVGLVVSVWVRVSGFRVG